jgi:oligogalacturonide lyase
MSRAIVAGLLIFASAAAAAAEAPKEWVDPATGHRIVRLSQEPGSASLYFHQYAYTAGGTKVLITTPNGGLATIELPSGQIDPLVEDGVTPIMAGRKTGQVYYTKGDAVYVIDPASHVTRKIVKLPPHGSVYTVNADETLLAGTYEEPRKEDAAHPAGENKPLDLRSARGLWFNERFAAHIPMGMFTVNVKTGEIKTILRSSDWLNHLQFSPGDPGLLMFCHEGPWHKVDRLWLIRTDGSGLTKVHERTMTMEIAGHEFWSADGKTVWYDLQTPRGEDFWVAGYEVATGRRIRYHLQRNEWSVHFNVSPDGSLFAGDGGDEKMVAHAFDGKWIYLFRPELIPNQGIDKPELIQSGRFAAERLVNLARHDYTLEPNVSFTPDMKWIVFRSNMDGPTAVYAVEVKK